MIDAFASAQPPHPRLSEVDVRNRFASLQFGTAIETNVRDNFDRSNQIVSLTVSELQATAQHNSELLEKTASFVSKWQETALAANRAPQDRRLEHQLRQRDTEAQVDEFTKRRSELQPISKN